jgi:YD repeat-containing protein
MNKNFRLIFLIFLPIFCFSQSTPNIIQPTPEAANISRYADVPVSLYTGKPQIEFPLYTLKCGNLEVPISLSYYASGIKVEDYPTWAGIGWALNAGGVITAIESSIAMAADGDLPLTGTGKERFDKLNDFAFSPTRNKIYHYNFLQFSGSFQIKNKKPVFRKHANLKIEFSYAVGNESITVTDDNGNKYYFELMGSRYEIKTDYYLTKIESANKSHSINFEYILGDSYQKAPHNSVFYAIYSSGVAHLKNSDVNLEIKNGGLLLSKIYTSCNDSVEFIKKEIAQPGSENSVFHHKKALDYINVYNQNNKLQSFHFKTNNVQTIKPNSGPYSDQFPYSKWDNKAMDYRLYLDGFEKIDSEGHSIESYIFDYYGRTADGKDSLPSQYSLAQDLDGYYNGQNNNTTLIPTLNEYLMPVVSGLPSGNPNSINFGVNVSISGANRNPDIEYMTMGSLKTIKYPTGGSANFYYSELKNPLTYEPFSGLKIDKIEYLNNDGSLQKKKKYVYEYPVLGSPIPSFWHYIQYNDYNYLIISPFANPCIGINGEGSDCQDFENHWRWAIELSPDPISNLELNEGPMIGYRLVTEFEEGNGRIEHEFYSDGAFDEKAQDHYFQINAFMYSYIFNGFGQETLITKNSWPTGPFTTDNNWKMGTLLRKSTYNEDGVKKQEINYNYTHEILELIPAINVLSTVKYDNLDTVLRPGIFYYQELAYISGWERLDSITETIDGVAKVTSYTYDSHKQVSQISTKKSNGDLLTTSFTHPYDYPSAVYDAMVARNMLAPVIEKKETKNTTQSELVKTNYSFWNDTSVNMTASNNATNHIYPLSVEVKKGESSIETKLNYNSYDNKGNITSVSKTNDAEALYIWGYDSQYPIAKIESATYSQFSSQVANLQSKSNLDNDRKIDIINSNGIISYQGNEGVLRSALASLRDSLADAMVTTYTYDPLVGVTSVTDPKGYVIYYEYDQFNRLKQVKDQDGKILSANKYHYKNQ